MIPTDDVRFPSDSEKEVISAGKTFESIDEAKTAAKSLADSAAIYAKIAVGISELKKATDWPQELRVPGLSDEAATIHLEFAPKIINRVDQIKKSKLFAVELPHPLSLKRNVCYIGEDLDSEDAQVRYTDLLKQLGVEGKIKMIPLSLVQTAIRNNDREALAELVEIYDTHIFETSAAQKKISSFVALSLYENAKCFYAANREEETSMPDFGACLSISALWMKPAENVLTIKVGHTGLTDEQLQANIQAVVSQVLLKKFPDGLCSLKNIQLKTGNLEGVSIHRDDTVDEEEEEYAIFRSAEILRGISTLKAVADWPKESASIPAFEDEAASVYMELSPKNVIGQLKMRRVVSVELLHPLGLNSRVCFLRSETEKIDAEQITATLRDVGVTGKIEVLPLELVTCEHKADDQEFESKLAELAEQHDTFLCDFTDQKRGGRRLNPHLFPKHTRTHTVNMGCQLNTTFGEAFCHSSLWVNADKGCYVLKVGETRMNDKQLQENIEAAFDFFVLNRRERFHKTLEEFSAIHLKTGTSEEVPIYVRRSDRKESGKPKKKKYQPGAFANSMGTPVPKKQKSQPGDVAAGVESAKPKKKKKSQTGAAVNSVETPVPKKKKSEPGDVIKSVESPVPKKRKSQPGDVVARMKSPATKKRKS